MYLCINLFLFTITLLLKSPEILSASTPPTKCKLTDSECQKQYFQNIGETYAPTGIPAIGVPVIDPFKLSGVSFDVMGFNITLVHGEAVGIGKCKVLHYSTNIETFLKTSELLCEKIAIKGHYTVNSDKSPLRDSIGNINGDGNINLELEDWYFLFEYPFDILKHDDGEIYMKANFDGSVYVSKVRGGISIEIDGVKFNNQDISQSVKELVEMNWNVFNSPIMKSFHDKSVEFYYIIYGRFFDRVPAKNFVDGDLSQYVIN